MARLTSSESGGAALVLAAVLAVAVGLGAAWWLAQPDHGIGQYERLGAEIGCPCGTCPNRPIATCGCGFADGMLVELRELVDQGQDDDEIMATFVARYSNLVSIKPQGHGLDLTAWAAPMLLFSLGAVFLGAVVLRWVRRGAEDSPSPVSSPEHVPPVDDSDAERLRARIDRELGDLEH